MVEEQSAEFPMLPEKFVNNKPFVRILAMQFRLCVYLLTVTKQFGDRIHTKIEKGSVTQCYKQIGCTFKECH
jgi:hypothetical protein